MPKGDVSGLGNECLLNELGNCNDKNKKTLQCAVCSGCCRLHSVGKVLCPTCCQQQLSTGHNDALRDLFEQLRLTVSSNKTRPLHENHVLNEDDCVAVIDKAISHIKSLLLFLGITEIPPCTSCGYSCRLDAR